MASIFESELDAGSAEYAKNRVAMLKLVDKLQGAIESHVTDGKPEAIAKMRAGGQLLFRERLALLLDEDSPFLELMPLVGYAEEDCPCTSICGIGLVNGVEVMVRGSVATVKGGTSNKAMVLKDLRSARIGLENRLMTVILNQSGGADLRHQEEVFHAGGNNFRYQAEAAKAGNTSICVNFGPSTAGGAYTPGMSDYTIMVKDKAAIYLGGPPLVKMATGEVASEEELGGAVMHSVKSGVSDFLAEGEHHAIRIARELVLAQHRQKATPYPLNHLSCVEPPRYDEEELLGLFDGDIKKPFDISEVFARITDGSRLTFFKPEYGKTTVCAFADIHGFPVGIIGNNGVLLPDSTQKATQFIARCNLEGKPVIFLQNITGFIVGSQSEQEGIVKHGSMLINAVSNSVVPLLTVVIGASYGAGTYAMCGRAYNPRFLFAWPCSKCGVMGPEQLAGVLDIISRRSMGPKLAKMTDSQKKRAEAALEAQKAKQAAQVAKSIDVFYTSSRAMDDGIIDPRDTRTVLGFCLSVVYNADVRAGGIWGVSRL